MTRNEIETRIAEIRRELASLQYIDTSPELRADAVDYAGIAYAAELAEELEELERQVDQIHDVPNDVSDTFNEIQMRWRKIQMYSSTCTALNTISVRDVMPEWKDAPERALYCCTHADGKQYWTATLPYRIYNETEWEIGDTAIFYRIVDVPIGIDWRLCVWKRPIE